MSRSKFAEYEDDLEARSPATAEPMSEEDEALHRQALRRFGEAQSRWSANNEEALDDIRFYGGKQWDPAVETERENSDRPCLTVNMLPQFVFQVTNEQRQNKPSIKVRPFDSKADPKTAEKLQGLVKHVEYNSGADVAYDSAFQDAVISGMGFLRVRTDYCNEESFDQDAFIERIQNRFSVYTGPAKKFDFSDMRWCFVVEDMTREEFRESWPDAAVVDWSEAQAGDDASKEWWGENTVRVAEYWVVKEEPAELLELEYVGAPIPPQVVGVNPDGSPALKESPQPEPIVKMFRDELPAGKVPKGYRVRRKRKSHRRKVCWYKLSGSEVLEKGEWAGRWIPIIPVLGIELHVEGDTRYYGLVRNAKDPQRMYNYWWTAETEMIALAPRVPWIGAEGQISGSADPGSWEKAATENIPYLEYKPVTVDGVLAPPPQRQPFAGPPAGVVNARLSAREDMKAATGIYSAGLGDKGPEKSGIAIQSRKVESDTATFHYIDNLGRSLRHVGRILVDLFRHIYDTPRVGRILGEGDKEELVLFNQRYLDPSTGETVMYDLSVGEYDVVVTMGPAYTTLREEGAARMVELAGGNPKVLDVGGDVIFGMMDGPGMETLAKRWKRTIPPEILGDETEDGKGPEAAELASQKIAQLAQENQALKLATDELTKGLEAANQKLNSKELELEEKWKEAQLKAETDKEVALINAASKNGGEQLEQVVAMVLELKARVAELDLQNIEREEQAAGPQGDPASAPASAAPPEGGAQAEASLEPEPTEGGAS